MDDVEKFIVISVGRCPWCKKAVELVKSKGFAVEIRSMQWGPELREIQSKLLLLDNKYTGWKTVPMIYRATADGDVFIGGYSELVEYFRNDRQEEIKEPQGSSS